METGRLFFSSPPAFFSTFLPPPLPPTPHAPTISNNMTHMLSFNFPFFQHTRETGPPSPFFFPFDQTTKPGDGFSFFMMTTFFFSFPFCAALHTPHTTAGRAREREGGGRVWAPRFFRGGEVAGRVQKRGKEKNTTPPNKTARDQRTHARKAGGGPSLLSLSLAVCDRPRRRPPPPCCWR